MPTLKFVLQDGSEVHTELLDESVTVGRLEENQIQLPDASVSSRHAVLMLVEGGYVLRDLGSTNGTEVNGVRLQVGEDRGLAHGDRLVLGSVSALYTEGADAGDGSGGTALPDAEMEVASVGASSERPSNFSNASPFQARTQKRDVGAVAVMAFGVLALLAGAWVIFLVFGMEVSL